MAGGASTSKMQWHALLGAVLESLLTPVGIEVSTDVAVMSLPPEADILLLRREGKAWTGEQLARLPDGIRESSASHVLVEFKYTESLNELVLCQAVGYDYFYRRSHKLKEGELQTTIVSAKTPHKATLDFLGYAEGGKPGVYHSPYPVLRKIVLLVLNELDDSLNNAPIKCFASRKKQKKAAFDTLQHVDAPVFSTGFWRFIHSLWDYWMFRGDDKMAVELSPEEMVAMSEMWGKHYLESLSIEERLAGMKPEEYLSTLKPEERLAGMKPEEYLSTLKPEERLAGMKPEDIEKYLRELKKTSSNN